MRASGLGEYIRVEPGDFTEDAGYRATVRLLNSDQAPTAIFAVDDMTCLGAQSAASEMNVDVPGKLSLVGYGVAASVSAFRPVVRAAGYKPVRRMVLVVDVLARDHDGRAAGGSGEVGPGPRPLGRPVAPPQVGGLLREPAGGHAIGAVDQAGGGHGGQEVHSRWTCSASR